MFALGGAIRKDAQLIGVAFAGGNFLFDDLSVADDLQDHLLEAGNRDAGIDVEEGTSDVGLDQAEGALSHGGEAANGGVGTEHDDGEVDAGQQIGEIVVHGGDVGVAVAQLVVDGVELFVGGLQFLFGGFQLLVGALQFFVAGEDFFVRGLQLFVCCYLSFDYGLQIFLGGGELLLELEDVIAADGGFFLSFAGGLALAQGRRRSATFFPEKDHKVELFEGAQVQGGDVEADQASGGLARRMIRGAALGTVSIAVPVGALEHHTFLVNGGAFFLGAAEGIAQLNQQGFASHLEEIEGGAAAGELEIAADVAADVNDYEVVVYEDL